MGKMEDNLLDLTISSPPYQFLRSYNGFSFDFQKVAKELFRVIKPGAVACWIVNDQMIDGSESLESFKQAIYFKEECGFRMHDVQCYARTNFSNPSSNRYHQIFDYLFILSKGKPKTFNKICDRKNIYAGGTPYGKNTVRQKDGTMKTRAYRVIGEFGMRHNIWTYHPGSEGKLAQKHPAHFTKALARDLIYSWSNKNELVYDPCMGGGTVAVAAKELSRNYIGSEISEEYVNDICLPRLAATIEVPYDEFWIGKTTADMPRADGPNERTSEIMKERAKELENDKNNVAV
jgi:site-specific DNA-methyltransferase (adenine-specific)